MKELLQKLNALQIVVTLNGDTLDIKAPKGAMTKTLFTELKENKEALIAFLKTYQNANTISKAAKKEFYVLSSAQHRIWLLQEMEKNNSAYNMPSAFELKGNLNEKLLEKAFISLLKRYEILRTNITWSSEINAPVQVIHEIEEKGYAYVYEKITDETEIENKIRSEINYVFDLEKDSLLRLTVLKTAPKKHILIFVIHHIVSDGGSSDLIINDFFEYYQALVENRDSILLPLAIQYKDYAEWQQQLLKTSAMEVHKTYWKSVFENHTKPVEIPTSFPRPSVKTYNGNAVSKKINIQKFENICREAGATRFMGFTALLNALFYKYTGSTKVTIGSPIDGRTDAILAKQVGFFVNTFGIHTNFTAENTFTELLLHVKNKTLEAFKHQAYPFDALINDLEISDRSSNPLFDVIISIVEPKKQALQKDETLQITEISLKDVTSKFDLEFVWIIDGAETELRLTYNTDIYTKNFIQRLIGHLENLLCQIVESPDASLKELPYLTTAEKNQILFEFNKPIQKTVINDTFISVYQKEFQKNEEEIAVVEGSTTYTYAQIDKDAQKLAYYLHKEYDIQTQQFVAVQLPRSKALIVAFLAIQKLGAVYVPIDANYPQERIDFIISDSQAKCVITAEVIEKAATAKVEILEEIICKTNSQDLAYLIYTSGSTGTPKAVMVSHENLLNLCVWNIAYYEVSSKSRATLYAGIGFDASLMEICPNLLKGAKIYPIEDQETRIDMARLSAFFEKNNITHAYLPTAVCHELIAENIKIPHTKILTGGDALQLTKNPEFTLYDNYGPSENTIVTTICEVTKNPHAAVTIGKPILNTHVYILDMHKKLLPVGIPGEIYVSGKGVSKGYWNRPNLTKERFLENPFRKGEKMYATGDLGKWLPDGQILFLGRKDHQIQIRGYRVELGEIEHVITQTFRQISQVSVIAKEGHLTAFFTSEEELPSKTFQQELKKKVPAYMVPNHFIQMDALPLTPNGKIDRKQLQKTAISETENRTIIAPKTSIEDKMVSIWKTILNLPEVSTEDDFFELGGHSLLLMKLLAAYQEEFQISLQLSELYQHTQLKKQAAFISIQKQQTIVIPKLAAQTFYEVSATQLRYWLIDKLQGKSKEFNITNTFVLPKNTDHTLLEKALTKLVARHETLRTTFVEVAGVPKQKIHEPTNVTLHYAASEKQAQQYAFDHIFNLQNYPLFKIAVTETNLYFNIHHSICDGWSVHILYRDLMNLYDEVCSKKVQSLPELPIQYKEFAAWQNQQAQTAEFNYQKQYWETQLQAPRAYLQLPKDFPETVKSKASVYKFVIDKNTQQKIAECTSHQNTSTFAIFLAAFKILLYKLTYERDSIVGIPVANRNHYQINNLAGCFLNTLMLRNTIDENLSIQEWLQEVHKTLTEGLMHQSYPFEKVLEALEIKEKDRFPLSPVFLNMVDFGSEQEALQNTETVFETTNLPPKFDLECYIKSYANGFTIDCVYDDQLFSQETIVLWMQAYVTILKQMVHKNDNTIATITAFENVPQFTQKYPKRAFKYFDPEEIEQTVAQRFEKQVDLAPNAIAVVANGQKFTYQSINKYANQLANYIHKNVPKTTRIALLVSHNQDTVISMLGVLKSGHSYVPIDVENPIQRIQYILHDAQSMAIVYDDTVETKVLQLTENIPTLLPIKLSTILNSNFSQENPINHSTPEDEAYVLYTSGSTGNPKGVVQIQKNMLHYIRVYTNNAAISVKDNLSVFSTYSFDASVKDIYGAILNGATVSFYSIQEKGLMELSNWISREKISIIHMVPTIYRYFLRTLAEDHILQTVRLVDLGGEASYASDLELFKKHFPQNAFLVNDYGPTEATIASQHFMNHDTPIHHSSLHLGKAVTETEVSIVITKGKKAAVYQEGEIVLKSKYISKGYLNLQEKTNAVFVKDATNKDAINYYTGDIGKQFPDGTILYLGRKDTQVKINGYRIELSEIALQISQLEEVQQAEVVLQTLETKEYITCYYKGKFKETKVFKELLKNRLPAYMIPSVYIMLPDFPLTRTGKIDRKALPKLTEQIVKTEAYKAPENDIQKELVTIWATQLHIASEKLGILDNFFEIGGNSLQAVTIINTINKTFDVALSIENIYEALTIQDLSKIIHFATLQKQQSDDIFDDMDEIVL